MSTLTTNVLPKREDVIKERLRIRIKRNINTVYPSRTFELNWSNTETSYTDFSDIYLKHSFERGYSPDSYTDAENHMIRMAHAYHERGHLEYDDSASWVEYQERLSSTKREDWESNVGFPIKWVQLFGNVAMDARLENLSSIEFPQTRPFYRFAREEGNVKITERRDPLSDFQSLYFLRLFDLGDVAGLHDESYELIDTVQHLIEKIPVSLSTTECLSYAEEILKSVWPTLMEWMENQKEEPDERDPDQESNDDGRQWGSEEDITEAIERLTKIFEAMEAGDGPNPEELKASLAESIKSAMRKAEKEAADDKAETDKELEPYEEKQVEVEIKTNRQAYSDKVQVKPYQEYNLAEYQQLANLQKREIQTTSKILTKLLMPVEDDVLHRQKQGKLKASNLWRAPVMNDFGFFNRKLDGTPSTEVRISVMTDISGSTSNFSRSKDTRIINEIRKALVLLAESTAKAKIPTSIHAFTESYNDTEIYNLKSFGKFSNIEKGMIGAIQALAGNRDTLALQYAIDQMKPHREEVRIIIMISDGQPCFQANEDENTMLSIVKAAEKQGIHVLCLYCGPDEKQNLDCIRKMYPGVGINASNLTRDLSKQITRIISNRK